MERKTAPKREQTCDCQAKSIVFLTCAGASNVGQIANQVAVKLTQEGLGSIYCLAGIGAHIEGMVASAAGQRLVVLDGCPVACARKTIEHAGLAATEWICVTEQGVKKNHNLALKSSVIESVAERVRERLAGQKT